MTYAFLDTAAWLSIPTCVLFLLLYFADRFTGRARAPRWVICVWLTIANGLLANVGAMLLEGGTRAEVPIFLSCAMVVLAVAEITRLLRRRSEGSSS
jgi:hypothetical protein